MVLICISLMLSDVEHLSVGHLCVFLGKKVYSDPLPISALRTGGKGGVEVQPQHYLCIHLEV